MLCIRGATILTPSRSISHSTALIEGDRLVALDPLPELPCPARAEIVEADGLLLAPGFIDLQCNGAFGHDFTAAPETIWEVAARLPQYGVTAFLPTIITAPSATIASAQAVLRAGPPPGFSGSLPLGLHLEGPFLNPEKRGAHNPAHLRPPSLENVTDWSLETGVRLVTLAPELPGALEVIQTLRERGVVVSAGHSQASYAEARAGLDAGLTYGTHLFNAMPPVNHRAPGLVEALLTDPRAAVGLIPDGLHLHPALIRLIWQSAGPARVNVVTDAMAALGEPPGRSRLGDFEVTVSENDARLNDGRLAGSTLSLDQGLRNLIAFTDCGVNDALRTVTETPARLLGLTDRGRLVPGCRADLVLLTPDLRVQTVLVGGQVVTQFSEASG
jgi:N-acetylglucosamine-6-phosphate deacetylase